MEGKVEVYSVPNRGTVFVIMLKSKSSTVLRTNSQRLSLEIITSKPRKENKRVLVVEDMPYNQEINKKLLSKCNNIEEILIANNGLEALEIYKSMSESYFDLILMDIDMPVMDGKTATKKIREFESLKLWKPANLVFLTAYAE